jgi:hypothetical protein
MKLTKDLKDLYKENCKPLKKQIKNDYRRWKECLIIMEWQK